MDAPKNAQNQAQPSSELADSSSTDADSTNNDITNDPFAALTIKLATAEAAVITAKDDWLRAKAETENIRRRSAEDVLKAHKFGVEKMADALLAVKDSMDAALNVTAPSLDAYKQGVELTARQLTSVFEKFSIQEVDPVGQKFDPTKHQAIAAVDSVLEANTVVSVMQKGYTLHERVLRPALVAVAKTKD
ncbi:MAG: nucleotide exchange factor GrpE [Pseudomonadota bacterium]